MTGPHQLITADQVVADDERTKEKGEDDVPLPPPRSTPPLISDALRVRQASTE